MSDGADTGEDFVGTHYALVVTIDDYTWSAKTLDNYTVEQLITLSTVTQLISALSADTVRKLLKDIPPN